MASNRKNQTLGWAIVDVLLIAHGEQVMVLLGDNRCFEDGLAYRLVDDPRDALKLRREIEDGEVELGWYTPAWRFDFAPFKAHDKEASK